MKDSQNMSYDELKHISTQYDSMFFHKNSNAASRLALGCSIELLDNLMNDKVDNGFAIIRPPGHHAMHDEPNGYCYFNNASIVARLAIEKYNLQRVLIVDWDGKQIDLVGFSLSNCVLSFCFSYNSSPRTRHAVHVLRRSEV